MSYADVFEDRPAPPPSAKCPHCGKRNTHSIYRPEVYEFNSYCRDCDKGFNK